ncbi:MAG: hypothetical protein A4E20_01390 [Nitrospira sp. SG-bin2]|nr:MAG: hypothetical protein A4E20_01390 [Nitrospira sp. SG-bin2]
MDSKDNQVQDSKPQVVRYTEVSMDRAETLIKDDEKCTVRKFSDGTVRTDLKCDPQQFLR